MSAARPTAHPVPGRRIPGSRLGVALGARGQPTAAARHLLTAATNGSVASLSASRYSLILTFRRDGRVVATPVWGAVADGRLYVRSERASGKVRRLRRDERALVAPCTGRGKPTGAPLGMVGRMLAPAEEHVAEQALRERYGLGRELFERAMDVLRVDMCYLELS